MALLQNVNEPIEATKTRSFASVHMTKPEVPLPGTSATTNIVYLKG